MVEVLLEVEAKIEKERKTTSPTQDKVFIALAEILEQCRKSNDCSKYPCPVKDRCNNWFDRVCELSADHPLSYYEFDRQMVKFNKIQPGLF